MPTSPLHNLLNHDLQFLHSLPSLPPSTHVWNRPPFSLISPHQPLSNPPQVLDLTSSPIDPINPIDPIDPQTSSQSPPQKIQPASLKHSRRIYTSTFIYQQRHNRKYLQLPPQLISPTSTFPPSTNLTPTLPTNDIKLPCTDANLTFRDLHLPDQLLQGLHTYNNIHTPSPIQSCAIPIGRLGADLIGHAKSGTGKTIAYATIILEAILQARGTLALILVPTRELAQQASEVILALSKHFNPILTPVLLVGGIPESEDIANIHASTTTRRLEIIIGTPGRVVALAIAQHLSLDLVKIFVIDEADRLLMNSFGEQVHTICELLPRRKQTMAFSATFSNQLRTLLGNVMRNPKYVSADGVDTSTKIEERSEMTSEAEAVRKAVLIGVRQRKMIVRSSVSEKSINRDQLTMRKVEVLVQLLSETPFSFCMVFTNRKHLGNTIVNLIRRSGFRALCTNAEKKQTERFAVIKNVRKGQVQVLVCSDLLARGIDFDFCDLVVQLDVPDQCPTYLHRVGRAGRYGKRGLSILFYDCVKEGKEVDSLQQKLGFQIQDMIMETADQGVGVDVEMNVIGSKGRKRKYQGVLRQDGDVDNIGVSVNKRSKEKEDEEGNVLLDQAKKCEERDDKTKNRSEREHTGYEEYYVYDTVNDKRFAEDQKQMNNVERDCDNEKETACEKGEGDAKVAVEHDVSEDRWEKLAADAYQCGYDEGYQQAFHMAKLLQQRLGWNLQ